MFFQLAQRNLFFAHPAPEPVTDPDPEPAEGGDGGGTSRDTGGNAGDPDPQPERELSPLERLIALANKPHDKPGDADSPDDTDVDAFISQYKLSLTDPAGGTFHFQFDDDTTADGRKARGRFQST